MGEILVVMQNGGKPPTGAERLKGMTGLIEMPNPGPISQGKAGCEVAADMPSPRLLVTHLPIHFLPTQIWGKKPKVCRCVCVCGSVYTCNRGQASGFLHANVDLCQPWTSSYFRGGPLDC